MKTHRILIVDDEPNVRSSLTRLLQREGYETILAESADDAFHALQNKSVSVILTDYMMPGQTGIEFLREVKKKYPSSVGIILTGKADIEKVLPAVNEGVVSHFFMKPWDNDVLKKTLQRAIEKIERRQMSESDCNQGGENVEDLEKIYPGITLVKESEEGAIIIDE